MKYLLFFSLLLISNSCMSKDIVCDKEDIEIKNSKSVKILKTKGIKGFNGLITVKYGKFKSPVENKFNSFAYLYLCKDKQVKLLEQFNFEINKMHNVILKNGKLEIQFSRDSEELGDIYWDEKIRKFKFQTYVDEEM